MRICFILFLFVSCTRTICIDHKPFETIVKYHSLIENNITIDSIVSRYIDIDEVYRGKINDSLNSYEVWKMQIETLNKFSNKKFSGSYNYYSYNISQYLSGDSVIISFARNSIVDNYYLIQKNGNWLIVRRNIIR